MNLKFWNYVVAGILIGITIGFTVWISGTAVANKVAVAEIKVEMKGISQMLDLHYTLLREIREDQKIIVRTYNKNP